MVPSPALPGLSTWTADLGELVALQLYAMHCCDVILQSHNNTKYIDVKMNANLIRTQLTMHANLLRA